MRLTDQMISRNYLLQLNQNLTAMNEANQRLAAGRNYLKASEDPATALKAFRVRANLARLSVYQSNVADAESVFTEVESAISTINDLLGNAVTQIEQGQTGTYSAEDRQTIAATLRSYQQQVLSAANSKFSGKYLFGGTNVSEVPFVVDGSGNLLYNGQDADTGTFTSENRYIDVGLGISLDASGDLVTGTAFDMSYPGIDLLGSGVDGDGITNNIYNLLGDIAEMFEQNDLTNLDAYKDKLDGMVQDIMLQYVGVGEKASFLSFLSDRFEAEELNAKTRQNELEVLETAEGTIIFGEAENAYNAALQMGLKIIQPSLLDYL